jgi:hypothetical protein
MEVNRNEKDPLSAFGPNTLPSSALSRARANVTETTHLPLVFHRAIQECTS